MCSTASGDQLDRAGRILERLERCILLCDILISDGFRRELPRHLSCGEAVHALLCTVQFCRSGSKHTVRVCKRIRNGLNNVPVFNDFSTFNTKNIHYCATIFTRPIIEFNVEGN
ncbi:MAG: Tn3 family transposase, partial [Granulosicoccus sp.]